MTSGMPILRQDAIRKVLDKPINNGNDLIASRNFEGTSGAEIILHIDYEETVGWGCCHAWVCHENLCTVPLAPILSCFYVGERAFDQTVISPVRSTCLGHRLIIDLNGIGGKIENSSH